MSPLSTALSLAAALLFGAGDFCGGLAVRGFGLRRSLLLSQFAGAALLLVLAPFASAGSLALADLPLSAAAGIAAAAGLAALYRGIATGIVVVVAPVSALIAALVPAMLGAVRGERPPFTALAGAVLCLPAIALLSWDDGKPDGQHRLRSSLLLGAAAGLLLGAFYAAVSLMRADAGLWPLFSARMVSMLVVALLLSLRAVPAPGMRASPVDAGAGSGSPWRIPLYGGIAAALSGGAFDASGSAAFLAASRTGPLMIVSVVTSLYPALTVILARAFFGQRVGARRAMGLVLTLAGVSLIGLHQGIN
ncbi:MAG: hypothetical protein NT080_09615 [Spirochaetes bacterium]|nr:hypothetical protein [Spirochaetota bacterium]